MSSERTFYSEAAKLIAKRGWWQEEEPTDEGGEGPQGQLCINRALIAVAPSQAPDAIVELGLILGQESSAWNDSPERTEEDVHLLLKYAAADELETWRANYCH